jgi:hypothetical protein
LEGLEDEGYHTDDDLSELEDEGLDSEESLKKQRG